MSAEAKLDSFEALIDEVSSALSDLAASAQERNTTASEMVAALVDMVSAMEARKHDDKPMADLIAAVKAIRIELPAVAAPVVTVKNQINVNPTPIECVVHAAAPVVHVMERLAASDYQMKIVYDSRDRIDSVRMIAIKGNAK